MVIAPCTHTLLNWIQALGNLPTAKGITKQVSFSELFQNYLTQMLNQVCVFLVIQA